MAIKEYLQETRAELTHVRWPTSRQALWFTVAVIAVALLTALFLFLFDTGFIFLIGKFLHA